MTTKVKNIFKSISAFLMDNFHQWQFLEYRLFKRGHLLYQHEVVKQDKSFDIFINDYLAEIQNFTYKTDKEFQEKSRSHAKIVSIFLNRPNLIEKYFENVSFNYKDYKSLLKEYNTTPIREEETIQPNIVDEEKFLKVKKEILKYESGEKQPKHIGQRMFGYLLKANHFLAYNDEQRLAEWQNFTGLDSKPEMSYLRDPLYNKNSIDKDKFATQLKQIEEFFYLIGLEI